MTNSKIKIPILSYGLWRLTHLKMFFYSSIKVAFLPIGSAATINWLGWGAKPSATRASEYAKLSKSQALYLEDGFIRSYRVGRCFPQLSLVVDSQGIYYDCSRTSQLEMLLDSSDDLLEGIVGKVAHAKHLLLKHRLSKYNHAPLLNLAWLRADDGQRVLVIDQTFGDMSVKLGAADTSTFEKMVEAALDENPDATIYVKTHPEVTSGRKAGYLTHIQNSDRVIVLREAINPISLIEQMDKVYVVTSTMGFEALLAGKPVTVFGLPWYAGWGVTEDRQHCARRTAKRSVDELFAAAYIQYTRYLNPVTHKRGDIFDVINWLIRQKEMVKKYPGRMICIGFRRWKASNIKPLLSLDPKTVIFVPNAEAANSLNVTSNDCLVHWGANLPIGLLELADTSKARILRMEDGFIRSVGLGSDLIPPLSIVLDEVGIYFDPRKPSDLENLLNTTEYSEEELRSACKVISLIIKHGITKYNIEPRTIPSWSKKTQIKILVPGQVEDDASILYGCDEVNTNLALLSATREANPQAYIVYKPHPDVMSGNRIGKLYSAAILKFADYIEIDCSIVSCIDACDEMYTMTSLSGFDALIRGKQVTTYGQPFYAGWGLTVDKAKNGVSFQRRNRCLTIEELVAGALLRYPIYWDWDLKGYTTCEAVINKLVQQRNHLEEQNQLNRLKTGYIRRQIRKVNILLKTWRTI